MRLRRAYRTAVLLAVVLTAACAHAPPNLSPPATVAWHGTRVITAMDVVRDIAVAANHTTPPALSTDTTRVIVTWHRTALVVVHQSPQGWTTTVATSLTEALRNLPPAEQRTLQPYVTLVMTVLQEVP